MPTIQVSAHISEETKARLERFVRRTGQTRGRVIEDALLQRLHMDELPAEALVPARIVLSAQSASAGWPGSSHRPPAPTEEMKRLFDDRRDPAAPAR